MEEYLIDNNIISKYFSGLLSENAMLFVAQAIDATPNISVITQSVITQIEALSWKHPQKEKEQIINSFIKDSIIIPLTPEIVKECVNLKRGRRIKTPDAIIAATAIQNNMVLISADKDFANISELKSVNPLDL